MARYSLNKTKYLLDPERQRLESVILQFQEESPRDCLLLTLALKTGARAQELLNIRRADINAHEKTVLIRGLKGSNDRELPLADQVFLQLERVMERANDAPFPIGYSRLRQIWETYRPVHKKFHCLRHTFAIQLFQKTRDLRLVQLALGHRNITNTIIYAEYVYSQEELRKLLL